MANRLTRVYLLRGVLHACARESGYERELGPLRPDNERCFPDSCWAHEIRLAGRFVAFARSFGGREGAHDEIVVVDMSARREVVDTENDSLNEQPFATACSPFLASEVSGVTTDLVLRSDGAVAWIAAVGCVSPDVPAPYRVLERGPAGRGPLDESVTIAPTSLSLGRGSVNWLDGGVPRTAAL